MKRKRQNTTPDVPRGEGGKWRPGTSPNPGGRPKEEKEVAAALRAHSDDLVRVLVRLALKGNVAALKLAFERAFGKAKQVIELTGADGGPVRFDAALLKRIPTDKLEMMRAALAEAEAASGQGAPQTGAKP